MGLFDLFKGSPEKKIGKCFDNAVKDVDKVCCGEPMLIGVMTFHAISQTYASLKENQSMMKQYGLSQRDYLHLLTKVMNRKGRQYINNWDQMMGNPQNEYMNY